MSSTGAGTTAPGCPLLKAITISARADPRSKERTAPMFDLLLDRCREQSKPLAIYAQTGSAVARAFLGAGVTAISAEPFPFSQFSTRPTSLYRYTARSDRRIG